MILFNELQLCMVLIKVADISNEARPMDVAEPWLECLLTEFYEQSDAEKKLGLPVTPFMDRDKMSKPSSQCSFIGYVLLPLFESIGKLYPQLEVPPSTPFIIIRGPPSIIVADHYKYSNELLPSASLWLIQLELMAYHFLCCSTQRVTNSELCFFIKRSVFFTERTKHCLLPTHEISKLYVNLPLYYKFWKM